MTIDPIPIALVNVHALTGAEVTEQVPINSGVRTFPKCIRSLFLEKSYKQHDHHHHRFLDIHTINGMPILPVQLVQPAGMYAPNDNKL